MSTERKETPRGFGVWEIPNRDYRGQPEYTVTVQESSLASERKVWLGREGTLGRMHLTEDAARAVRDALTEWLGDNQ